MEKRPISIPNNAAKRVELLGKYRMCVTSPAAAGAAPLRSTVDLNCAVVNAPSIASISAVQHLREAEQVLREAPERKESE